MTNLIDSHCHIHSIGQSGGEKATAELWSKLENTSLSQVVKESEEAGVSKLIAVGCDLSDSRLSVTAASKNRNIFATIGIHPHESKLYIGQKEQLEEFASLIKEPKVVAIGECGLDYFYEHSDRHQQIEILEFQLNLATSNNLPVVFHVRQAFKDFWPILDNFKNIRGVLHSYTDNQANLSEALKRQLYIGVNGIVTFTKGEEQLAMYRSIPLANLLLETDSPFLTPAPFRGSINQPKYVRVVAEYLAGLREESLESIANQTTQNARELFKV